MGGEPGAPMKHAFVEFSEQQTVGNAFQFNGTLLGSRAMVVSHSSTAIIKPTHQADPRLNAETLQSKSQINKNRSRSRSRTRKRSRSSSRSRRRRSKTRSRSRSRSKGRAKRSRSREKKRSRERKRSRSRKRFVVEYFVLLYSCIFRC